MFPSILSLLGFTELCRRGDRKIVRARGDGRHQGNCTFQTQGTDVHINLAPVTAYARPIQEQNKQNPHSEKNRHKITPLPKKLFTTDSY